MNALLIATGLLHSLPLAAAYGPLITFLFILVFWAIRATSSISSAQNQKRQREMRRQIDENLARNSPPAIPSIQRLPDRFQFPTRIGPPVPQRPSASVYRPPPPLPRPAPAAQPRSQSRQTMRPPAPEYRPATPPQHPSSIFARPQRAVAPPPSDQARQPAPAAAPAPPIPAVRPVVSVGAASIARWMRPKTLQAQFILTEIFQPPLSMRDLPY